MKQQYLTTAEVAERYRTSPETVRYWRYAGTGPQCYFKSGRRILYVAAALDEYDAEKTGGQRAA